MSKIAGIQAARGAAAISVVLCHLVPSFFIGRAGVDVFFVISGFVMVISSGKLYEQPGAWKTFLRRRIIRIAPLYWLATFGAVYIVQDFTAGQVIRSLFFIPVEQHGLPLPVLSPGWTLNNEMYFYVVFATFLWLPRALSALAVTICISIPVIVGIFMSQQTIGILYLYYFNPIVLEFVAGMWLALLWLRGFRLSGSATAVVAVLSISIFSLSASCADATAIHVWKPAAVLLVGAVALGPQWLDYRIVNFTGEMSYSLYLTHYLIVIGPMHDLRVRYSLVLAMLLGAIVHILIEKPLTKWLNNLCGSDQRESADIGRLGGDKVIVRASGIDRA